MLFAQLASLHEGHAAIVDVADDRLARLGHREERRAPVDAHVVAGARGPDGKLLDARTLLRAGGARDGRAGENTTIGVVASGFFCDDGGARE